MGNTSSFYKATSGGWLEESLRVSNLETMTVDFELLVVEKTDSPSRTGGRDGSSSCIHLAIC